MKSLSTGTNSPPRSSGIAPPQGTAPPPPPHGIAPPPPQGIAPPPPHGTAPPPPPPQGIAPPPPVQGMLCVNIPCLDAPHADGLVPWLGSVQDLPPDSDVMPPGFLGFVFAFPDGRVVRTTARKAYIVDGFTASFSMDPLPPPNQMISIRPPMRITFSHGGRITVTEKGFMFVENHAPMLSPHGCEIVVPVGGVALFRQRANQIDTSSAPV